MAHVQNSTRDSREFKLGFHRPMVSRVKPSKDDSTPTPKQQLKHFNGRRRVRFGITVKSVDSSCFSNLNRSVLRSKGSFDYRL
ncbi:unnamed protein product [Brassica rapa subsp. trilocularis]